MKKSYLNLYTCSVSVKVCSPSNTDVSLNCNFNIRKYIIIRMIKKRCVLFPFIPLRFLIYILFCFFLHLFNLRFMLIPKRES